MDQDLESIGWFDRVPVGIGLLVSVAEQQLHVMRDGRLMRSYPCSTASAGLGCVEGSGCTPTGWHEIGEKIGHGLPAGAVLRGRRWTGACWRPGADDTSDLILSRILWLTGLEEGHNRGPGVDSRRRFIYIHGTNAEDRLGSPVSHGCVRLSNSDVIELHDLVDLGSRVFIDG